MKKYLIENEGCDDATYTELNLTDNELKTLIRFAKENNKTGGGCKPVVRIYEKYTKDEYYYSNEDDDLVEKVKEIVKKEEC